MSRVISSFIIVSLFFLLSACATSNALFSTAEERQDRDGCLQIAQVSGEKWGQASFEQIYQEDPYKQGEQKPSLHLLDKVLKRCEATLSTPRAFSTENYDAQIGAMRQLRGRIEVFYGEEEKKLFLSRTGDKTICGKDEGDSTLLNFFYGAMPTPRRECLYEQTKKNIPLVAMQASPQGVLATARWATGNVIYLSNDNSAEKNLVDGAAVQPGYFVYEGIHRYQSLTGERSVHAFSRIDDPFKGILFYDGH